MEKVQWNSINKIQIGLKQLKNQNSSTGSPDNKIQDKILFLEVWVHICLDFEEWWHNSDIVW